MAWRALVRRAARSAPAALSATSAGVRPAPLAAISASSFSARASTRQFAKAAKKGKGSSSASSTSSSSPSPSSSSADSEAGSEAALAAAKKNMAGAVLNLSRALAQMRPGRADAGLLDELRVPAYGQHVALAQLAQVSVSGDHALRVAVYDAALVPDVRRAVEAMNPVFSVREDAGALDVSFPKMSKETRAELLKAAKKQAEQARQHVRRARQDAMGQARKLKDASVSEDAVKQLEKQIQKATDAAVDEVAKLLAAKEKDLAAV